MPTLIIRCVRTGGYPLRCFSQVVIACVLIAGCSKPPAPTATPLQGRVEFTKGGTVKDLSDSQSAIEFESVDQPGVRSFGEINEDGTFALKTIKDGVVMTGVVEGAHRGRLNMDHAAKKKVDPRFLSFDKSGITIKVPSPQEIVIKVWR